MGWLPIFKRKPIGAERSSAPGRTQREGAPRTAAATADTVQQARTRARRRLIGAAVLVVAGVIGFPLLFETQPRPVAIDIPIEIPRKEGSPALAMPSARTSQVAANAAASSTATRSGTSTVVATGPSVITETGADAGREVSSKAASSAAPTRPSMATIAAAKPSPGASHTVVETGKPVAVPARSAANADATRAAALLDGKTIAKPDAPAARVSPMPSTPSTPSPTVAPSASASSGPSRFIVQAGAFADAAAARDTRVKLERLGLKTYTQVADTASGPRVRVRLGPFATRAEADKALAKAKAAGLAAVVISL